jgi:hypothetical protein
LLKAHRRLYHSTPPVKQGDVVMKALTRAATLCLVLCLALFLARLSVSLSLSRSLSSKMLNPNAESSATC